MLLLWDSDQVFLPVCVLNTTGEQQHQMWTKHARDTPESSVRTHEHQKLLDDFHPSSLNTLFFCLFIVSRIIQELEFPPLDWKNLITLMLYWVKVYMNQGHYTVTSRINFLKSDQGNSL